MEKNDFIELVISSLKDIISEQDKNGEIPIDSLNESTYLIGHQAILDSLGLVSLIVDIEQKLNEKCGISITIADERAMSQEKSPFRTVDTLAQYVKLLIKEQMQNA